MDLGADKSMPNKWWANLDTYIPNKGELYSAVQFSASPTLLAIYTDYLYLFELLYVVGNVGYVYTDD